MPAKKQQATPVISVYKDDGVWWAEMNDEYESRFVFSSGPETFIEYVSNMLYVIDLTVNDIEWKPVDEAAGKFLTRAQEESSGKKRRRKKAAPKVAES